MSLSPQVTEHLNDAMSSIRSALWHGAKNERPSTITQIAKVLNEIDVISKHDDALDTIDSLMKDMKDIHMDMDDD
jgi:hypothetical protein